MLAGCLVLPALCWSQTGSYQENIPFLKHLAREKLYTERLFVLNHLSDTTFTSDYYAEKAWTFQTLGQYDSALHLYNSIAPDSILISPFRNHYFQVLFQTSHLNELEKTLSFVKADADQQRFTTAINLMNLRYNIDELKDHGLDADLQNRYTRYYKACRKSPVLAGLYSAAIPGAGKLYAGKKRQALNMLIMNVGLGLQAYESYSKAGISSARFIVFGGLFSVFYVSNIYGAVKAVLKSRNDERKQLHHDLTNYYLTYNAYPGVF